MRPGRPTPPLTITGEERETLDSPTEDRASVGSTGANYSGVRRWQHKHLRVRRSEGV